MADTYAHSMFQSGTVDYYPPSNENPGNPVQRASGKYEFDGNQSNNDVLRILKGIPANAIVNRILLKTDGLTGLSDVNVGLYKTNLGAVKDDNCFGDAVTLASASKVLDGMKDVAIENFVKKVLEHAGDSEGSHSPSYDIALTLIAAGSASGTIAWEVEWQFG